LKKNILVVDNLTDRIIFFIERFGSHNLTWDVSIVYLILQSLPKAIYLPFTESDFTTLFNI